MIALRNLELKQGNSVLLKQANATIYPKQRFGIIGVNGCGKSSLFSLIVGELQAEDGECDITRGLRISHMAQEVPALDSSAIDYVLDGDLELRQLQCQLSVAESNHDGEMIASIHDQLSSIDAYRAPSRAAQLLDGLGFSINEQLQAVKTFSGGWRVRLNLAKALMSRSDVLLLDEPTNHLDLDTVIWLENWLN